MSESNAHLLSLVLALAATVLVHNVFPNPVIGVPICLFVGWFAGSKLVSIFVRKS
jgi:hypothetical protein